MPPASKPQNETLRQAAVERLQLVGVPQEESLERVVRLAARLLGTGAAGYVQGEGERPVLTTQVSDLGELGEKDSARLVKLAAIVLQDGEPLLVEDFRRDERFSGHSISVLPKGPRFFAGVPVLSPEMEPVGALCVVDEAARRASGEELATLADLAAIIERELVLRALLRTDPLTGLYNRRHFEVEIEREWKRASRNKSPVSALLVNLDRMGDYNEIFGREHGDTALRQVARKLAHRFLRSSDLLVRYGGDEFLVVLPETGEAPAVALADELRELVASLDVHHPQSPDKRLTVSIGCAAASVESQLADGPKALVDAARNALAAAKKAGRNRTAVAAAAIAA